MENTTEGPVIYTCTACAARYPLNWTLAGKTVHCKACGQIVTVDPERLTIPAQAPADAIRQLRDALAEAAGMTEAAQAIFLQQSRNRVAQETERLEEWKNLTTTKNAEITTLTGRIGELEALVTKQETELKDLQARLTAQETRGFELALLLKTREERLQTLSTKESLLKSLCDTIENSLKKDIDAHQTLLASLRQQLKFT